MGLLDDAIREHLELKRRAGADAMDVARAEREALGRGDPVDPSRAAAVDYEEEHYAAPPGPAVEYGQESYAGPPAGEPAGYEDESDDYLEVPAFAQDPRYAPTPVAPPTPPPAPATPPPGPPVQAAPPPPPSPPPGPTTEEYRVPPEEAEAADVLEQTPEFLQETPEHDRLWFEQAPPQEFDFDK